MGDYSTRHADGILPNDFEPIKRVHSTQLVAGLATVYEIGPIPYGRCEALPSGRTFPFLEIQLRPKSVVF